MNKESKKENEDERKDDREKLERNKEKEGKFINTRERKKEQRIT